MRLARTRLKFSQASIMIEAAIAGQGIVLARRSLVGEDIRARRLIFPLAFRNRSSRVFTS